MSLHFYRFYQLQNPRLRSPIEICYYINARKQLSFKDLHAFKSIIGPFNTESSIPNSDDIVERGPKLWICSEWGSNAKAILEKCGIESVIRIEKFIRGPRELVTQNLDEMVESIYECGISQFDNPNIKKNRTDIVSIKCEINELKKYSKKHKLGFTDKDVEWYHKMWEKQNRKIITELELHDLAQSNSEHSRHHIFGADMYLENESKTFTLKYSHSLFDLVKKPLKQLKSKYDNSTLAFCDNSSAIDGFDTKHLIRDNPMTEGSPYHVKNVHTNILFTAETHNFPTGIAPFPGAATGIGGRIRDVQAIGRGGMFVASAAGYCVSSLGLKSIECIEQPLYKEEYLHSGAYILIQASNGASDYGNKIGEPIIQGFTRSFGLDLSHTKPSGEGGQTVRRRIEWMKPIMFTSGIGMVYSDHLYKQPPKTGMFIGRVGGPAYRIGVGGGTASSTYQVTSESGQYQSSVQRGDPEMEQKVDRFIRACIEMREHNPIISIHDQGAGGMCNVTKEIVETDKGNKGAIIDIRKVVCGDETMTLKELWIAEYQEQNTFLCNHDNIAKLKKLALREGVPLAFVGNVTNDGIFTVHDTLSTEPSRPIVEFKLNELKQLPKKSFVLPFVDIVSENIHTTLLCIDEKRTIKSFLYDVLKHPSVCSKRFLTNKVDRSVGGLIAQQQCVGPLHTPLADVAIIANSYFGVEGAATSIGEKPITGIVSPVKMAKMAVGEMVMNMVWAKTKGLQYIKCSGNWMWPAHENREKRRMLLAARALSDLMCEMKLSIDGGKDSLSMSSTTRVSNQKVDCPPQLVISGYTAIDDITKKVTPDLKSSGNGLLYINVHSKYRLGGSIFVQTLCSDKSGLSGFFANDYPDVDDSKALVNVFETLQFLVDQEWIASGHDISDGGLITTVLEMAFAGNKGLRLNIDASDVLCTDKRFKKSRWVSALFAEELGCVIEVPWKFMKKVKGYLNAKNIRHQYIGHVTNDNTIELKMDNEIVFEEKTTILRDVWENTSFHLEALQSNHSTVNEERNCLLNNKAFRNNDSYGHYCSDKVWQSLYSDNFANVSLRNSVPNRPRIAIIREEGSNGDREMCAAFWSAGFEPYDIMTSDMISEDSLIDLKNFNGIVFVGGFTFSDAFGAAKGWESIIKCNTRVRKQFEWFYSDYNKTRFSLGICNGCQLMCRMGWVGKPFENEDSVPVPQSNKSGRFESRFVKLKVLPSNSVLLKDMEGCTLGVWVAHGEGRFGNSKSDLKSYISPSFPLRYIDEQQHNLIYTENYPANPNGSAYGIAGAISKNGLHLAMMPHPERCVKSWQNPWYPESWQSQIDATYDGKSMPWAKLFKNGYDFINRNKK